MRNIPIPSPPGGLPFRTPSAFASQSSHNTNNGINTAMMVETKHPRLVRTLPPATPAPIDVALTAATSAVPLVTGIGGISAPAVVCKSIDTCTSMSAIGQVAITATAGLAGGIALAFAVESICAKLEGEGVCDVEYYNTAQGIRVTTAVAGGITSAAGTIGIVTKTLAISAACSVTLISCGAMVGILATASVIVAIYRRRNRIAAMSLADKIVLEVALHIDHDRGYEHARGGTLGDMMRSEYASGRPFPPRSIIQRKLREIDQLERLNERISIDDATIRSARRAALIHTIYYHAPHDMEHGNTISSCTIC